MKLIVAGSRDFNDYSLLERMVESFIMSYGFPLEDVEIVSGGASGADKLGERYAKENNLKIKKFPADWDKHGKKAGYLRNKEMADYATHLIAFWNGSSNGTAMMISLANKKHLEVTVINYQP